MSQAKIKIPEWPSGDVLYTSYLPAMDGLRAVAILTVITYHFGFDEVPGDLGVTLFFVLSGFLITRLLLVEFRKTASINFTSFHQRRLLKIFPAYYLFLLTTFVEECLRGYCWSVGLLVAGITQVVNYYNAFTHRSVI